MVDVKIVEFPLAVNQPFFKSDPLGQVRIEYSGTQKDFR